MSDSTGLDSTGFKRKRFADLFDEMEAKAKEVFGENVNTSERSILGLILRLFAWFLAAKWQVTEAVYYSGYKNTAEGSSLDRLGPYVGITRIPQQRSKGHVTLTGTAGYTVPSGFRVATESGIYFETIGDVTLGVNGTGEAAIQAVTPGLTGNVAAGTIVVVVNPTPSVSGVTNASPTSGGREQETDAEFRERWDLSVSNGGAATIDSLRSALLATAGVRAAIVVENNTAAADIAGRPPKSFEAYVLGGSAADIGQTILNTKAAGIEAHGSQSVDVADISGNLHTIKYSLAEEVSIHIRATVTRNTSYPTDGAAKLITALVRYIGGEDADGQVYVGLNMGDDVIYSRLIAAAYSIPGIEDIALELSIDGTEWSMANLSIAPQQVAQTSSTLITVIE